jgi:hypothetical protein
LRGFLWFLKIWAFGSSCPTSKEEAFEKKKKKKETILPLDQGID